MKLGLVIGRAPLGAVGHRYHAKATVTTIKRMGAKMWTDNTHRRAT